MATNFIDRDLLTPGAPKRGEPAGQPGITIRTSPERPEVLVSGTDRMARHRDDVTQQVTGAVSEIERLRIRQEELEREKKALEELTRKQVDYEAGKRDMIEKLNRSLILLEKEETQAERLVELLAETRGKFQETLADLKSINEQAWGDSGFREELSRALAKVEAAKDLYKRALSKIDASSWHKAGGRSEALPEAPRDAAPDRSFGYWVKVGLAVSLPVIVVLVLLFLGYLAATGNWSYYAR